jgi:RNA-binding protein Musashi
MMPDSKLEMFRESTGPSVVSRRLNRKLTQETEATSTTDETDTGSQYESDELSDAALEVEVESVPQAEGCMTADPFDFMPSFRVRPAFSEAEISQMVPANAMYSAPGAPQMMQPMQMPPMQPMSMPAVQQMGMQTMQQMVAAQSMAFSAPNPSPGRMVIQVPVPVPVQMPSMPTPTGKSVPVPPGFKLVRIPETAPQKETNGGMKTAPIKSEISNPASTERKIFVGGLNPATTGQTLREYFSNFGPVTDAKVIREGEKSKGFGFVQFKESIPSEVLEQAHIIDQRRCGVGPAFHREGAQEVVA